jgi:hypothetical protein
MSRLAGRAAAQPRDEGVEPLSVLLDHLGRLLAEEYVASMTTTLPTSDEPEENP